MHKQWGEMAPDLANEYCCCQVFLISHGVYLIALHCILHAAYATGLVLTSYHKPKQNAVIYLTAGSNLCLVPTGILIFWANLYENWKGARASGVLVIILGIFNSVTATVYFIWFIRFKANSQLDKAFFWKNHEDWIYSSDLPFTFWHFFSFQLIPVNLLWFYYSKVICKLSAILKARKK